MKIALGALALAAGPALADGHLMFAPGEGDFSWQSLEDFAAAHDLTGQSMTMTGPGTGDDKTKLEAMIAYFEDATGAEVSYSGSDSFEQDIVISTQAGSAPNIAVFPQPGLVGDLAAQGALTPLDQATADWLRDGYAAGQSWIDLATFDGPDGEALYGFFFGTDVKSLVWYVPEAFDEAGYEIPETMEELKALTEQIVDDGGTPWCIGLGSGAATGWPATDWVEDMLLRTAPPEVYDAWVAHEIPFDDPTIVAAIEEYGWFINTDAHVVGGSQAVATTDFRDSPQGLFSVPPACYMHRQASFIPSFFPDGTTLGEDVDFFYFPAYAERDLGTPVLGSGAAYTITNDSPAARAFIDFLKTPIAHEVYMAQGNFLTPHLQANQDIYPTATQRALGEILTSATVFRYDASDLMPGEIGADAFWTGMVDYTTGTPAAEVAATIEERWSSIR